jgi:hypothetical protein
MANEVRFNCTYSFSENGFSAGGSQTLSYSITGDNAFGNVQTIGSGVSEPINFQDLADVRYCYLRNGNPTTGNASISLNSGQSQVICVLRPGEFLAYPPNSSGIWASGQFSTVSLQVCANES